QSWNMFYRSASSPGWPVFVGELGDGREISLLEEGKPFQGATHPKPDREFELNARWHAYLTNLLAPGTQAARDLLAPVVARDWNRRHPELAIVHLKLLFVRDGQDSAGNPERQTTTWFDGPV